eukprot:3678228-Rhodomonas_salina.2
MRMRRRGRGELGKGRDRADCADAEEIKQQQTVTEGRDRARTRLKSLCRFSRTTNVTSCPNQTPAQTHTLYSDPPNSTASSRSSRILCHAHRHCTCNSSSSLNVIFVPSFQPGRTLIRNDFSFGTANPVACSLLDGHFPMERSRVGFEGRRLRLAG